MRSGQALKERRHVLRRGRGICEMRRFWGRDCSRRVPHQASFLLTRGAYPGTSRSRPACPSTHYPPPPLGVDLPLKRSLFRTGAVASLFVFVRRSTALVAKRWRDAHFTRQKITGYVYKWKGRTLALRWFKILFFF